MSQFLDIDTWIRKDHFKFFKQFEEPFFGVCVDVDATKAYQKAKEMGASFFLYYLHKSLVAVNKIEPFRYRIDNDKVLIHDEILASATINRDNGTFGFSYIPYFEDFKAFEIGAKAEMERVRNATGLELGSPSANIVHYSSLPWIKFTALSHARSFSYPDSVPKISFGKLSNEGEKKVLPVSIHVHHALMDGFHVGQHIELFETLMNE